MSNTIQEIIEEKHMVVILEVMTTIGSIVEIHQGTTTKEMYQAKIEDFDNQWTPEHSSKDLLLVNMMNKIIEHLQDSSKLKAIQITLKCYQITEVLRILMKVATRPLD